MGDRESYAPGTFSWASLGTADAGAAAEFYGRVFGWEAGEDGFRLAGKRVAGMHEGGPGWLSYVTVEDAAGTAARAKELGGELVGDGAPASEATSGDGAPGNEAAPGDAAPGDAEAPGDARREVTIRDPAGATLRVSEAAAAERVNDPGCMVWNELATPDAARARAFYGELLGWSAEEDGTGYATIKRGDAVNGGIRPLQDGEAPNWLVYFSAARLDEAAAAVTANGGSLVGGPFDGAIGRIALAADPQGAVFALFEGPVDP